MRIAIALAMSIFLCASLQAASVSAVDVLPENQENYGYLDFQGIKGELERTTNFDVVPGQDFSFDMSIGNTRSGEQTVHVYLRLDMPNGGQFPYFEDDVVIGGGETEITEFAQLIPEGLELYGRYTMKLFINERMRDFFQFDVNDRAEIIVRWDDGVMVNATCWYDAGNKWAIRGCMPGGSVIDEATAYILSENDPYWPWPDATHQEISVEIWDAGGAGGLPGAAVFAGTTTANPATSEATVYPGVAAPQPHFYVVNHQLTSYPYCEGQGVDGGYNHPQQMFGEVAGEWQNYPTAGGDFMMWAIGTY
jgi:hypothetical protein